VSHNLSAAVYFERLAALERRPEKRARLLTVAREFRFLGIAEAKRFVREIPKRPAAASVKAAGGAWGGPNGKTKPPRQEAAPRRGKLAPREPHL
jgi:hypothetical protein